MAESPVPQLDFNGQCPDCGRRVVSPPPLDPELGDDFDWQARDYDAIRLAMLEELAARFPERKRWTPADIEVVLVEVLATALDQLSDMADRVTAEAYLETARRPESVRRLLNLIGYDAVAMALLEDDPPNKANGLSAAQKLDQMWTKEPARMEHARRAGPRSVTSQRRMVTVDDYTARLEEHPIIRRAAARAAFTGSWTTLQAAVVLRWPNAHLDDPVAYDADTIASIMAFHKERSLEIPDWTTDPAPSHRMVLHPYLDSYRMAGQEVMLIDAVPVGIIMHLTVEVGASYFQSEVRRAIAAALGTQPGGFFEPGRLLFGEDLHASDLFQTLLGLEGVGNVCLTLLKRVGSQYRDRSAEGLISLDGLEIAVCENDPQNPGRGYYQLSLFGGRKG